MFCVECGREGELVGSLCIECYSKRHATASIPDHVDLALCAHCSAMETDKGWEDVGSVREAAALSVERALRLPKGAKLSEARVHLAERDERNMEAKVDVTFSLEGHTFERALSTIIRLKRGSCTECSKQQGNYYEAILQIRGQERELDTVTERSIKERVTDRVFSMRKSSREVFVSKVEKVKGGLDFYFSTIPAARNIARELQESRCAEYKESSSLWGRRDGKDIYRMTYLVRLPGFGKGDIVFHGGREYYVRGLSKGVVHGFDLVTGEERAIKIKDADACALTMDKSRVLKAQVISESARELQVLDPETNAPVEVKKPGGFSRKGEQVRLVKTKRGAYVLSDSW
ncbi:MAG TPA: NMD3-related protein [Thermoplasmata archaeon]|jgi:nonsense-mediated mRNA decay protein 3